MRTLWLAALPIAGAIAMPAHADPLQDQVLASIKASDTTNVGFTQTAHVEHTGGKPQDIVTRYDPRAAANARWTLVQVDGRAPTAKETADAAKHSASKAPRYAQLADWFGGPATRVGQTAGTVTYRFQHLPANTVKMGSHDASADTIADAVVNISGKTPYVERVRFASDTSFRMKLVAKVERFVFTTGFAPMADGRIFTTGADADMTGSLLGKSGFFKTRVRFTDVRAR